MSREHSEPRQSPYYTDYQHGQPAAAPTLRSELHGGSMNPYSTYQLHAGQAQAQPMDGYITSHHLGQQAVGNAQSQPMYSFATSQYPGQQASGAVQTQPIHGYAPSSHLGQQAMGPAQLQSPHGYVTSDYSGQQAMGPAQPQSLQGYAFVNDPGQQALGLVQSQSMQGYETASGFGQQALSLEPSQSLHGYMTAPDLGQQAMGPTQPQSLHGYATVNNSSQQVWSPVPSQPLHGYMAPSALGQHASDFAQPPMSPNHIGNPLGYMAQAQQTMPQGSMLSPTGNYQAVAGQGQSQPHGGFVNSLHLGQQAAGPAPPSQPQGGLLARLGLKRQVAATVQPSQLPGSFVTTVNDTRQVAVPAQAQHLIAPVVSEQGRGETVAELQARSHAEAQAEAAARLRNVKAPPTSQANAALGSKTDARQGPVKNTGRPQPVAGIGAWGAPRAQTPPLLDHITASASTFLQHHPHPSDQWLQLSTAPNKAYAGDGVPAGARLCKFYFGPGDGCRREDRCAYSHHMQTLNCVQYALLHEKAVLGLLKTENDREFQDKGKAVSEQKLMVWMKAIEGRIHFARGQQVLNISRYKGIDWRKQDPYVQPGQAPASTQRQTPVQRQFGGSAPVISTAMTSTAPTQAAGSGTVSKNPVGAQENKPVALNHDPYKLWRDSYLSHLDAVDIWLFKKAYGQTGGFEAREKATEAIRELHHAALDQNNPIRDEYDKVVCEIGRIRKLMCKDNRLDEHDAELRTVLRETEYRARRLQLFGTPEEKAKAKAKGKAKAKTGEDVPPEQLVAAEAIEEEAEENPVPEDWDEAEPATEAKETDAGNARPRSKSVPDVWNGTPISWLDQGKTKESQT